ncbi:sugar ABC transporter ATP-binding protein, partial [Paraburkholderia sp. SIMBA_027]
IYLGQESQFVRFGIVDWKAMRAAAKRQLDKIGVDIDVTARTSELTFAARQMVELAKALTLEETVSRPLVILLDEPTSV